LRWFGNGSEIAQHVPIRVATRFAASATGQQIIKSGIP
jgi:hypothetical protein